MRRRPGGGSYLLAASAWAEVGGPVDMQQHALVEITYYSGALCAPGTEIPGSSSSAATQGFGRWEELSLLTMPPPAARSARVELNPSKAGEPGFPFPLDLTAYFDNAYFGAAACSPQVEGVSAFLCLDQGRFSVQASWRTPDGRNSYGRPVPFGDDSGGFWFFSPDAIELEVKVLDACTPALGNRFWVFAAGLTNVDVTLAVTDTRSGTVKTYHNPQGTVFRPITDTGAFATCP